MSLISRRVAAIADDSFQAFRCLVVQGARQVGKSTLAAELATALGCPSVSLDEAAVLQAVRSDAELFTAQLGTPAVVDEVQRGGDELIIAIKRQLDSDPSPGQFILTGSTNFLTSPHLSESLAGRVDVLTLWPFSQGELRDSPDAFVDRAFEADGAAALLEHAGPTADRAEYLEIACAGGYPEPQTIATNVRSRWFDAYLETVLRREIETAADLRKFDELLAMARLLLSRTGSELVVSKLSSELGLDRGTVGVYAAWLEAAFLVHRLPPWTRNAAKRAVGRHKLHAVDSGLVAAVLGATPARLNRPGETAVGPLLETFVAGEIAKQLSWSRSRARLFHYRDRDQNEVDLVIEHSDGRVVAVEVKAATLARPSDARSLRLLRDRCDRAGGDFVAGVVLHTGTVRSRLDDRLVALPISDLWTA